MLILFKSAPTFYFLVICTYMCFTKLSRTNIDVVNNVRKELSINNYEYTDNCDYLEESEIREIDIKPQALTIIQLT